MATTTTTAAAAAKADEKPNLKAHIPALDGVRGLAIAAVLLFHSFPDFTPEWELGGKALNKVMQAGPFGVDLFFVLSGFLITGILIDARGRNGYFKNFYARRALRLFPVYYVYLAFVLLVLPRVHQAMHTSIGDYEGNWWWYVFYFSNWKPLWGWGDSGLGHIWSLAVEEQFYMMWPTVVLLAGRRYLPWVCVLLILSATSLRCYWALEQVPWNQIYRLTITRWDTMALGALAALAVRSEGYERYVRLAPKLMIGGLVAFLIVVLWSGGPEWAHRPMQSIGTSCASIGFAGLVLYSATRTEGRLISKLRHPALTALGKYSYFIYVVHGVVISHVYWVGQFVIKRIPSAAVPLKLVLFVLVNALVFYIATLSWRFFEAPVLRLKRHFETRS